MSAPVGVLAVMEAVQRRLDASFGNHSFPEFEQARAAVAELIEADRKYDEAKAAFDAAFSPATHTRRATAPKHDNPVVPAYHEAVIKRRAALARVGGAA